MMNKGEILLRGCRGASVRELQKLLHLVDDGIYGPITCEAVKDFQREHGLVVDGVVGDKTWSVLLSQSSSLETMLKVSKRRIDEIIVHCTATKEGQDLTVSDLRRMHKSQGWSDIGYHYVVTLDGKCHVGRDVDLVGAHVSGRNSHSIGVVYVGGLDISGEARDTRTNAQKEGLRTLLVHLRKLYPKAKILGHRDCSKDLNGNGTIEPFEWVKQCPCFNAIKEYSDI